MRTAIFLTLAFIGVVSASYSLSATPNVAHAENGPEVGEYVRTLNDLRDHLSISEDITLRVESHRTSSSGVRRVRVRQEFRGVPIRVATLQASQDENGFFTGSVSGLCPTIPSNFDTSPSNSKNQLKVALAQYLNDNDSEVPEGKTIRKGHLENFKREKQIHIDTETGKPMLVYFVSALVDIGLGNGAYIRYPRVIFEAGSLNVIAAALPVKRGHCPSRVKTCPKAKGGNEKERGLVYGPKKNQVCLNASFKNNKCVLQNDFINVKTVNNEWKRNKAEDVVFDCDKGPDDESNGACSPAADAFYYAQVFYDVLHKWGRLERTHREPHTLYVHFGSYYPNSFWDGASTTFGDGIERTYSYAIHEIIGHEMCHAVTDSFGNLVFANEAEAISEAFSDICGKAVTYFLNGDKAGWEFANALIRHPSRALRYFDDPTRDGVTIASHDHFTSDTDPYIGMGIYLKAFYSIVAQQDVRFRDAFEAFVFANQIYWNEETNFEDGACGVVRAARDLGLDSDAFISGFGMVDISLTDDACSLKGSEDRIIYGEESGGSHMRHAEINSFRQARYIVKAADGKSKINVSVSCPTDSTVDIKSNCISGSLQSYGSSASFPLAGDTEVIVTAEGDDIVGVTVYFDFE